MTPIPLTISEQFGLCREAPIERDISMEELQDAVLKIGDGNSK